MTDPLASGHEVILFESAGVGRSNGQVPATIGGMATHALAFLDGLDLKTCDVLGFSLGGMVAQQMALDRPSSIRKMILVGTAPRGLAEVAGDTHIGFVSRNLYKRFYQDTINNIVRWLEGTRAPRSTPEDFR